MDDEGRGVLGLNPKVLQGLCVGASLNEDNLECSTCGRDVCQGLLELRKVAVILHQQLTDQLGSVRPGLYGAISLGIPVY